MTKKILIAASGTGGHVIPALNIAEKLLDINYKITWIGTKKGIENKLVNNEVIKMEHISSTGIRGKSFFGKVIGLLNFIKAFFQCYIIIRREKPIFTFGFGGYISTSASLASFFCRVPVYVHEANSVPGTANKINHMISKKHLRLSLVHFQKIIKLYHQVILLTLFSRTSSILNINI